MLVVGGFRSPKVPGFGFGAFFVAQSEDLMLLSKTLDHLKPGIWSGQTVQSYIVERDLESI